MSGPRPNYKRGKKPDVFSTADTKPHILTATDRLVILEAAAVHGITDGGRKVAGITGFDRWTVQAVAGCQGIGTKWFAANLQAAREKVA